MKNKATLSFNDKVHDLNLISGSENEVALDISRLRQEANLITIDAGFKNTGSCQSAITFLDGETGILVPVEQQKTAPFEPVNPDKFAKDLAERNFKEIMPTCVTHCIKRYDKDKLKDEEYHIKGKKMDITNPNKNNGEANYQKTWEYKEKK